MQFRTPHVIIRGLIAASAFSAAALILALSAIVVPVGDASSSGLVPSHPRISLVSVSTPMSSDLATQYRTSANGAETEACPEGVDSRSLWPCGIWLSAGQHIVSAEGRWSIDPKNFDYTGPDGYDATVDSYVASHWSYCMMRGTPGHLGTLLARYNGRIVAVGSSYSLNLTRPSFVEFSIKDGCPTDNGGFMTVNVW